MTACAQVTTTLPTESDAADLASTLIGERLAACVQVLGPVKSTYRWQGAVEVSTEWICLAKTAEARVPALLARIRELHAYRLPEIIATSIGAGDPGYLEWLRSETTPEPERT